MIVVTTGTNGVPFDRLLRAVAQPDDEELVVQHGPSRVRPTGARCVEFVPYDELRALVLRARVVITHGGVGSILLALAAGRRPIVVPRLAELGEAVDDHQLHLGRRLSLDGHVLLVEDERRIGDLVREFDGASPHELDASPLVDELRRYIASVAPLPSATSVSS